MKKTLSFLLTALTAVTLLTAPAAAASFTDSAAITHPEAVDALAELDVIAGRPDGSFDPNGITLRSEMAKMLSILMDLNPQNVPSAGFTDVYGTWAQPYIDHCCSLGLISGQGGTFDPNGAITGTEAAKMLLAAAGYSTSAFTGSGWNQQVNAAAEAAGLYEGFDADPAAPLTRDGAAVLICNGISLMTGEFLSTDGAPTGIAALPDGSMLVTDTFLRTVYRLSGRELTTYAGAVTAAVDVNGRPLGGHDDAAASASTFKTPWAAAPFLDGWAVSDAENNVIRLIKDGQVQTLNPSVSDAYSSALSHPTGLAAASDGSLYISDTHNGLIRQITPDRKMITVAKDLKDPMGLCWQDGVLYIAETGANRIVRLKDGVVSTVAGSGEDGYEDGAASAALFSVPQAVTAASDGTLYVSDTGNSAIRVIQNGQVTTLTIRDMADEADSFPVSPAGLVLQGRRLYVCDSFTGMLLMLLV